MKFKESEQKSIYSRNFADTLQTLYSIRNNNKHLEAII